jgi:hypothetical protein
LGVFVCFWPLRLIRLFNHNLIFFYVKFFLLSFWFFDWLRNLFSVTFFGLNWDSVDCAAASAPYHITSSIWIADLALARTTDEKSIERKALVHIITATADINLGITGHILFKGTVLASNFPKFELCVHFGQFRFFDLLSILHFEIAPVHVDPSRVCVCAVTK